MFRQPLISTLGFDSSKLQGPVQFFLRGQSSYAINPPFLEIQSIEQYGHPPLHPQLETSQSINCCMERGTNVFFLRQLTLSMLPAVLKDQQLPHEPWSLMGPTAFLSLQSQLSGVSSFGWQFGSFVKFLTQLKTGFSGMTKPNIALAQPTVRSVNLVYPQTALSRGLLLSFRMVIMFLRQTANRYSSIAFDSYFFPYSREQALNWLQLSKRLELVTRKSAKRIIRNLIKKYVTYLLQSLDLRTYFSQGRAIKNHTYVLVNCVNSNIQMQSAHQQASKQTSFQELSKPLLCCPSGNRMSLMCTNQDCREALECGSDECKNCNQKHKDCDTTLGKLISTTNKLNKLFCKRKELFQNVHVIDNQFIKQLNASQKDLIKKCKLKEDDQNVISRIYDQKAGQNISGVQAKRFAQSVNQLYVHYNNILGSNLKQYGREMQRVTKEAISLKQNLFRVIDPQLVVFDKLQSIIINESQYDDKKRLQFLIRQLNNPKELQLIFRASDHDFSATSFHKFCDNIQDTLTLVKTQFGKTIAGYTHYSWNEVGSGQYVNKADKKAFLVQLDLRQKMVPVSESKLIYCHSGYGPTFGGGHDLRISDKCHQNGDSYAYFPHSYNLDGVNQYANNQESYRAFCGAENNWNFKVKEYEVFKVIFNNSL